MNVHIVDKGGRALSKLKGLPEVGRGPTDRSVIAKPRAVTEIHAVVWDEVWRGPGLNMLSAQLNLRRGGAAKTVSKRKFPLLIKER